GGASSGLGERTGRASGGLRDSQTPAPSGTSASPAGDPARRPGNGYVQWGTPRAPQRPDATQRPTGASGAQDEAEAPQEQPHRPLWRRVVEAVDQRRRD
ncbi:MAG: hypothetical protein J2P18_06630, partial [Nocardia sp.]|nr:hypothetical protein [Nocardia sp.]